MSPQTNWTKQALPQRSWIWVSAHRHSKAFASYVGGPWTWSIYTCLKGTSSAVCSNSDQDLSMQTWSSTCPHFFFSMLGWQDHNLPCIQKLRDCPSYFLFPHTQIKPTIKSRQFYLPNTSSPSSSLSLLSLL